MILTSFLFAYHLPFQNTNIIMNIVCTIMLTSSYLYNYCMGYILLVKYSFFKKSFSGAVGGITALGCVLGQEVCRLEQLFKDQKLEEAKELQRKLLVPTFAVSS